MRACEKLLNTLLQSDIRLIIGVFVLFFYWSEVFNSDYAICRETCIFVITYPTAPPLMPGRRIVLDFICLVLHHFHG